MLFRKLAFGTLDKLRGEITYEYEANGQLRSRNTGSITTSESFRYDPAANQLDFNARQFDKIKDNRIRQWRDQETDARNHALWHAGL
ncbi:hypothetical protein ACI2KD_17910 [Pseudomonas monteilii]|nr:hypothetical protein [Pseudomonas entomophila]